MSYKIAIGSSDGVNIDLKFGAVDYFSIYEVEGTNYEFVEKRSVNPNDEKVILFDRKDKKTVGDKSSCNTSIGCGNKNIGCGNNANSGCSGNGGGCLGPSDVTDRVDVVSDCRCVVCAKVGFQAQKQFEKKAISVFDIECDIELALQKITAYYDKIDSHRSLRS